MADDKWPPPDMLDSPNNILCSLSPLVHDEQPRSMPLLRKLFYCLTSGVRRIYRQSPRSPSPFGQRHQAGKNFRTAFLPSPFSRSSLRRDGPYSLDRKPSGRPCPRPDRLHHNNLLPRHPNPVPPSSVYSTVYFCTFYSGSIEVALRRAPTLPPLPRPTHQKRHLHLSDAAIAILANNIDWHAYPPPSPERPSVVVVCT